MGTTFVKKEPLFMAESLPDTEQVVLSCLKELSSHNNPRHAVERILETLRIQTQGEYACVFRLKRGKLRNIFESCAPELDWMEKPRQELDLSVIEPWRPAFEKQECLIVENVGDQLTTLPGRPLHLVATFPLVLQEKFGGFVAVENPAADRCRLPFLLGALGFLIVSGLQRIEAAEELKQVTYYDSLTGLGNRVLYIEKLHHPLLIGESLGMVLVDINGLKNINDLYGHVYGDHVIIKTAQTLCTAFSKDSVYRISGDEFAVICKGPAETEFYERVTNLKNAFLLEPDCSVSVGYQWTADCKSAERLAADTDSLMYRDKRDFYRNNPSSSRYRNCSDDILGLSNPGILKRELAAKNFVVYLQPKYDINSMQVIGSEALARYRRSDGGIVAPDQFIPALEDARLIGLLDFYVFGESCLKIQEWLARGFTVKPVSVNFSRYSILERDFVRKLLWVWEQYHIPQELLEIEITETVGNIDMQSITDLLRQIRNAGFRISIDDFGVKYANLSLLLHAQVDTLKLDKSLLYDLGTSPNTSILIRSIAQICRDMRIRFIVEGVETPEQLNILRQYDCYGAQGFLFSQPIPFDAFELLVY